MSVLVSVGVETVMTALARSETAARDERRAVLEREDARERRLYELVAMLALRTACPVPPAPSATAPAEPAPAKD